jgi:hypothetical protein
VQRQADELVGVDVAAVVGVRRALEVRGGLELGIGIRLAISRIFRRVLLSFIFCGVLLRDVL